MFATALAVAHLLSSDTPESRLLEIVNKYRAVHHQAPLTLETNLCKAADGHAQFMAVNNVLTHNEQPGLLKFTGSDLAERAHNVGWTDALSELVGYSNTTLQDSVQAIFDSPCHRIRFLKPGRLTLGASAQSLFVCLLIGGEPAPAVVVSPAPFQTGVPTHWNASLDFAGTKTGPGSKLTGYPVVLLDTTQPETSFKVTEAEITTSQGSTVPITVKSPENDPHFSQSVALIPESTLCPGVTYKVKIVLHRSNGTDLTRAWSFTTAPQT